MIFIKIVVKIHISEEEEKPKKKKKKKKKKIKKEKENEQVKHTEEEKHKIKIYKKGMHLLRKAIKSYKKRNNKDEFKNRFIFWKNIINEKLINNNEFDLKEENPNKENEKEEKDINSIIKENDDKIIYEQKNKKENILYDINNINELNKKMNKEIISILEKTEDKKFNNLKPDIFNKILVENNKKLLSYKLFCLYNKYNDTFFLCKKVYLKRWNKNK